MPPGKDNLVPHPKVKEMILLRDWCKGCRICVSFCPKKVLELDNSNKVVAIRQKDCIGCRLCEIRCPDLAIEIQIAEGA